MARNRPSNASKRSSRAQRSKKSSKSPSTVSKPSQRQKHRITQDSAFLRLPAEIRNSIYEYAAVNSESISIGVKDILYNPPLSLVCRQVRKEYTNIYIEEAPKHARTIKVELTNFIHTPGDPGPRRKGILDAVQELSSRTDAPSPMNYVFRIWVTNTFDHYLPQMRSFRFPDLQIPDSTPGPGSEALEISRYCEIQIFYEPKTFDVQYCKQLLPKLRWSLGTSHQYARLRQEWIMIEDAFEAAFRRYELQTESTRKRKRQ